MAGGAPAGNQNAKKGREWRNALNRALEKRGNGDRTQALDALAEKFLDAIEDMTIATEKRGPSIAGFDSLRDTLDGRPTQGVEGPDGGPVIMKIITDDSTIV